MATWSEKRSVSLRFKSTEMCSFIRKATHEIDSSVKDVVTTNTGLSLSSKTVTTITEYHWQFTHCYELLAFRGTGGGEEDILHAVVRSSSYELKTDTDSSPRPAHVVSPPVDTDVTWLLQLLHQAQPESVSLPAYTLFSVDRLALTCHTPRRNEDVEAALTCFSNLSEWCGLVLRHFLSDIFPLQSRSLKKLQKRLDLSCISAEVLFVPVVPLMVEGAVATARAIGTDSSSTSDGTSSALLSVEDRHAFLQHHQLCLQRKFDQLRQTLPSAGAPNTLITAPHAELLVCLMHAEDVTASYAQGVWAIEHMLRKQLVAAIGKEIQPRDLAAYMHFHNHRLFLPAYRPRPFCYAVRRSSSHAPEGVLSIEEANGDSHETLPEPIYTHVSSSGGEGGSAPSAVMQFSLDASARVRFGGQRHVHGLVLHSFLSDSPSPALTLRAEARQFSSYIVMIGRISSASSFDPQHAMIVQNKDDLRIPLELETIPSSKQFKDAISSLSPEQQRFAKAFRGMQLESTLFGVLVIQIKPQLEKVLNLPPDSLTKEIALTQDLMELFVKYQVPSDLLSFSAGAAQDSASTQERLRVVRTQVADILQMVGRAKDTALAERAQERQHAAYSRRTSPSTSTSPSMRSSSTHSDNASSEWSDDEDEDMDDCFGGGGGTSVRRTKALFKPSVRAAKNTTTAEASPIQVLVLVLLLCLLCLYARAAVLQYAL